MAVIVDRDVGEQAFGHMHGGALAVYCGGPRFRS